MVVNLRSVFSPPCFRPLYPVSNIWKSLGGYSMAKPATQIDNVMDHMLYYNKWQKGEGIPIIETFFVQTFKTVPLLRLYRVRRDGAFLDMKSVGVATSAQLC